MIVFPRNMFLNFGIKSNPVLNVISYLLEFIHDHFPLINKI